MMINDNEYEIRKKYCPAQRKNIIVKVFYGKTTCEECLERSECDKTGGCRNEYLHSSDKTSHSS